MALKTPSSCLRISVLSQLGLFIVTLLSFSAYAAETQTPQKNIHIRTLASSCAACHGTHGNSRSITPVLAGLDATYFSTQMHAFKNGGRSSTVMFRHAEGLTEAEINQLADYFSQQKRVSSPSLKSQPLKASHE
jgi:cytochrome subunit of sulfide dehydrogenase